VLFLLATLDMVDMLEDLAMADSLDMEVSLEEGLLEQLHLWPVLMDSPTVESTGVKTAHTTFHSNYTS